MVITIEKSWHQKLQQELKKYYIENLKNFLDAERSSNKTIYPSQHLIFNAFRQTPFHEVKVVIMGQDPYHGPGQAHGLSFSVPKGITSPPSLKNIFKELKSDLNIPTPSHGCLISWAQQGVLLLNATLTVRRGEPKSHYGKGWEQFTDAVIDILAQRQDPLVFLLWGVSAKAKCDKVKGTHHAVFEAAHPSPYSASSFLGCKHFSKTNQFLTKSQLQPIDWNVDNFEVIDKS